MSAARCAIRMRSKETDLKNALVQLRKDLVNGPQHCFGIHTNCCTSFCTIAQDRQQPTTSSAIEESGVENPADGDGDDNIEG